MWLQHQKIVSLALAWGVITGAAAFECYSRNKIAASRSQFLSPADAAKLVGCQPGITACCFNDTQYCDVDLLCHDRKTKRLSRQYCSDPSWPEDRCSKLCPHYEGAGTELISCDEDGKKLCCPDQGLDCCDKGDYYEINDKGIIIAQGNRTITPTSSPASSPTSSSTSSSTLSTLSSTSSTTADAESEKTKLGVGLGVGLGVPFLLICAAALFFFQRYQRLRVNAGSLPEYPSTKETAPVYLSPAGSTKPPAQLDSKPVRPELATTEHLAHELQ